MNVYIIGVGPGNGRYLIKESEEKIENADIIIGAKRLIKPYCNKKTFAAITPFDIISIIKSNNQCEKRCLCREMHRFTAERKSWFWN